MEIDTEHEMAPDLLDFINSADAEADVEHRESATEAPSIFGQDLRNLLDLKR